MNETKKTMDSVDPLVSRLRRFNEWRRCADFEMLNPTEVGQDIDAAIAMLEDMRDAIRATLDENGHLADGANSTLRHLVLIAGDENEQNSNDDPSYTEQDQLNCDLCGKEINDFKNDLYHATAFINNGLETHTHLCHDCFYSNIKSIPVLTGGKYEK